MNDAAYFEALDAELVGQGLGRPVILVDLDRVDHNLRLIDESISHRFRVVTKSLPSLELIDYVMGHAESRGLMAFHLPFVPDMLARWPAVDILMGKPFLPAAVEEFLGQAGQDASNRVQWLVDTEERIEELLEIAGQRGVRLRVNVELDIGLHRGGVATAGQLGTLLDVIADHPAQLRFSGMMGYEAHVPFMPDPDAAFDRAMDNYAGMVEFGRARQPQLFEGQLTFNSGGSKTCHRFSAGHVVNDVAAGSAVVKPATFELLVDHQPALFIAAPVIRKFPRVSRTLTDPATAMSLYLYGGGWAADLAWPPHVTITPHADPPNQNLLPNQCLFETHVNTPLSTGHFVFFRPQQSDAMVQFEEILAFRGGRLVDRFRPFPRRF